MVDSTQVAANRAITVPFHGADLYVVEHDAQPYTPMKPIITGMGLTWHGQHAKIKANARRWGVLELRIPSAGGLQDMLCMPLRKLPGWLSGIEAGKVKNEEARAKVVEYQNECDDVLWQYWNDGIAINPRAAYSVNPGDVLTKEHAGQAVDPLDGPAMKAARKTALDYFDAFREAMKQGKNTAHMDDIPQEVLQGLVASAVMSQRVLTWFDPSSGEMRCRMVPSDSVTVSFSKDDYNHIMEFIPMNRVPDMLAALQKRVACHIGAFGEYLQRGRQRAVGVSA